MTDYQNKMMSIIPEGWFTDVLEAKKTKKELNGLKKILVWERRERNVWVKTVYAKIKEAKEFIKANVKKRIRKEK